VYCVSDYGNLYQQVSGDTVWFILSRTRGIPAHRWRAILETVAIHPAPSPAVASSEPWCLKGSTGQSMKMNFGPLAVCHVRPVLGQSSRQRHPRN